MPDSARRAQKRNRSILHFFTSSLLSRGIGVGCQLLQVPVAMRYLGEEAFGVWLTLFGIAFMFSCGDLGIGQGAQNLIAEALGRDDQSAAKKAFFTSFVFLGAMVPVLLCLAWPILHFYDFAQVFNIRDPGTAQAVRLAVPVSVCFWCLGIPLGLGVRLAFGAQLGWMNNFTAGVSQLALLAAVYLCGALQSGATAFYVITGASTQVVYLVYLLYLMRRMRWMRFSRDLFDATLLRRLLHTGGFFFAQQMASLALFNLPALIVASMLGPTAIIPVHLVQRVFNLFSMFANATLLGTMPAYAEAKAQGDWAWIRKTLWRSLGAVAAMCVIPMMIVSVFVRPLIAWWVGSEVVVDDQLLVWLVFAFNALLVLQQPFNFMLTGLTVVGRPTVYAVLTGGLMIGLLYALTPWIGIYAWPVSLIVSFIPFAGWGIVHECLKELKRGMEFAAAKAWNANRSTTPAALNS